MTHPDKGQRIQELIAGLREPVQMRERDNIDFERAEAAYWLEKLCGAQSPVTTEQTVDATRWLQTYLNLRGKAFDLAPAAVEYLLKCYIPSSRASLPSIPSYYIAVHTGGKPYTDFDFPIADNIGFKVSPNGAWMRAHDVMKAMPSARGTISDEMIYGVCRRIRDTDEPCQQCPAVIKTSHGPGVQMCRSMAEEICQFVTNAAPQVPESSASTGADAEAANLNRQVTESTSDSLRRATGTDPAAAAPLSQFDIGQSRG